MEGRHSYNLERLRAAIRPFRLHFSPRLRSTNDHAMEMRRRHALYAPAVVLAGAQTHGRGRAGNTWWSDAGCIIMTVALPVHERLSPSQIPLIAGVAVRNALANLSANPRISLKWPNDLVMSGKKLAGLLCERIHRLDLIGVGVNVNVDPKDFPAGLRRQAISLSQSRGGAIDKTEVVIAILKQLHPMLSLRDEYPFASILREYDRHHWLRGRRVTVTIGADHLPIKGTCQGLDSMGRLLLRRRSEQHRIVAGSVHVE